MPVNVMTRAKRICQLLRTRLAPEHGFTMVIVLGVLLVTSLLTAATMVALQGEIHLSSDNLASKRAYAAASAGVQAYLYQLNQNPNYWETCANDTSTESATAVPGASDGEQYSFQPIWANGNTGCTSNMINALVDNTTGTIRFVFTGYSGTNPQVTRSIVTSFRMNSPLDFLWYTHFESVDDDISGYSDCGVFYRQGRSSSCNINWISADVMNGPSYTDDQYLIDPGADPTFGRSPADKIESSAPGTTAADICAGDNCQDAKFVGTPVYNATPIPTPSDNSELLTDAQQYGEVYQGTTTITLSGNTATVVTCTASTCSPQPSVNLTQNPIIYVENASGCSPAQYNPSSVSYPLNSSPAGYLGCAGDVYVAGNYTTPVTIAAENNIIIDGGITTTADGSGNPTGGATLGLVANEFVRVMHGCSSNDLSSPTIDAAILALNHSFIVDNWSCGNPEGTLTVHGAIAQYFRGPVGTVSGSGGVATGYAKNYNYDDRLADILPPFLFDISDSGWHISRETLCTTGSTTTGTGCQSTTG
jgi:Tfp pilus assembly protein PilX